MGSIPVAGAKESKVDFAALLCFLRKKRESKNRQKIPHYLLTNRIPRDMMYLIRGGILWIYS